MSVEPQALIGPCKVRIIVKARCLLCYWAVSELGLSMTELAQRLDLAVSTVSAAVQRGRKFVDKEELNLASLLNMEM